MFGLSTLRLAIYGGLILLVVAAVGIAKWRISTLTEERDAANRAVGALQATVDQLAETNRANVAALAALEVARIRADAAVLTANDQASAARAVADQIKRRSRNVPVPNEPFCARAPRLCAVLDGLRATPEHPDGSDQDPGRATQDPGRPAALPGGAGPAARSAN